jgi:hypothetical protein
LPPDVEHSSWLLLVLKTLKGAVPPDQLKIVVPPAAVAVNPVIPALTGAGVEKFSVLESVPW